MRLPKIKIGQIGYAPVINTTRFGAFVDVGTERGIFMPFAEMKGRPKEGEYVWVKLYEDKSHRLAVSMEVEDEMRRASRAATDAKVGDWVEGAIYNMTDQGAYLMTRERWIAFLHRSEFNGPILIGQMIKGRITFLREDGRINISLRQTKENANQSRRREDPCSSSNSARARCPMATRRHRPSSRPNSASARLLLNGPWVIS